MINKKSNFKNSIRIENVSRLLSLLIILTIAFSLTACNVKDNSAQDTQQPLRKVKLLLDYVPNTNHTGFFVALYKNYYAAEGLDVEITQSAEGDSIDAVASGQMDFGVSFQESVTAARTASAPRPVKAIAAILQHNTSGFASPTSKNIKSPADFIGKRYGGWGTNIEKEFIKTLMKKDGADPEKVTYLSNNATDIFAAFEKDADFSWIYYGWDGVQAQLRNYPINFIKLQDIDSRLDFYTPLIITNGNLINTDPDVIKRFMRATTKGYTDCVNNPTDAASYLMKKAPDTNADLAKASQKYLKNEYISDASQWGVMNVERWQTFGKWMFENGLIEKELVAKDAFTNDFLPK